MQTQTAAVLAAVLVLAGSALAAEGPESHADHPQKVVALSAAKIVPASLRMGTGDVLTFQNFSGRVMKITFLEPKNLADHVKCQQITRVSEDEAVVAGVLFKRRGDQVVGFVAPGAFVSVCSLAPGRYVYTAAAVTGTGVAAKPDGVGEKGEIVVE